MVQTTTYEQVPALLPKRVQERDEGEIRALFFFCLNLKLKELKIRIRQVDAEDRQRKLSRSVVLDQKQYAFSLEWKRSIDQVYYLCHGLHGSFYYFVLDRLIEFKRKISNTLMLKIEDPVTIWQACTVSA